MSKNNGTLKKQEENIWLHSLSVEVDNIFFSLRKADQIIKRELNFISQKKYHLIKNTSIDSINADRLKRIIDSLQPHHLLVDEYIIYMLRNEDNSIFSVISKYNEYIDRRINEKEIYNLGNLQEVDEKLVYYIRHLGAMTYHLNIHLNLLTVLLKNASIASETQQINIRMIKDIISEYMVNEWGERLRDVRFLEITIESRYALVSWALDNINGDAILLQNEGYWQLMNIRAGSLELKDFENADIPLEVAQRILRLHHQKLGY
jgi:hypothetical protein